MVSGLSVFLWCLEGVWQCLEVNMKVSEIGLEGFLKLSGQLKNLLRGQKEIFSFNPTLLDTVFSQRGFVCACVINQFFSNIA